MSASDMVGIAAAFAPISLDDMDAIKLMNRVDSKFVTNSGALERVLRKAIDAGYMALDMDGSRILGYDTLYYDTPGRDMYLAHHNGRLTRQKVRTRTYLASGDTFVEVKDKDNHGRTRKKRTEIPTGAFAAVTDDSGAMAFLDRRCRYSPESLSPALRTRFERITLVNPARTERLTIDTSLSFSNPRTGAEISLGDGVIVELKQDALARSQMLDILLSERIHPLRVSKYCIGSAITDPSLKQNRFKLKVRMIEKTIDKRLTI